jgi:hypothetical protein
MCTNNSLLLFIVEIKKYYIINYDLILRGNVRLLNENSIDKKFEITNEMFDLKDKKVVV